MLRLVIAKSVAPMVTVVPPLAREPRCVFQKLASVQKSVVPAIAIVVLERDVPVVLALQSPCL